MQQEYDFREVAALDLGCVAFGAVKLPAFSPEPMTCPWSGAAGSPLALLSRGTADRFDEKRGDSAVGVVSRDSSQAAVYDVTDAVNSNRGFGDIRGDNNFAK